MTGQCFPLAFPTEVDCGDQKELATVEQAGITGPPEMSYPEPAPVQDPTLPHLLIHTQAPG